MGPGRRGGLRQRRGPALRPPQMAAPRRRRGDLPAPAPRAGQLHLLRSRRGDRARPQHRGPGALEALPGRHRRRPVGRPGGQGRVRAADLPGGEPRLALLGGRAHLLPVRPRGHRQRLLLHSLRRGPPAAHRPRRLLRPQPRERRQAAGLPRGGRAVRARPGRGRGARGRGAPGKLAHPAQPPVRPGRALPGQRHPHPRRQRPGDHHARQGVLLRQLGGPGAPARRAGRCALPPADLAQGRRAAGGGGQRRRRPRGPGRADRRRQRRPGAPARPGHRAGDRPDGLAGRRPPRGDQPPQRTAHRHPARPGRRGRRRSGRR